MMSSQGSGSRAGQETHMQSTHLDDLSDYDNMVQEDHIEPDYFIDRPPSAIFQQESPGHDKTTMLNDRAEQELYDFDSEIEPILQVLVGKALEISKIEVIEEYEIQLLMSHRKLFKTIRESELIATQRLERERVSYIHEIERRNQQVQIVFVDLIELEKRQIARHASKRILRFLKRNTMSDLIELGQLRSRFETDLGSKIVNDLHLNAINDTVKQMAGVELVHYITSTACTRVTKAHSKSIIIELKRREDAIVAAKMDQIRKQNETVKRRKRRAELREEARIECLQSQILKHVVHQSMKVELKADTQILDVVEQPKVETIKRGHLSTFGGLIGELIIAFSTLSDYITTMTATHQHFKFTSEHFENFFGLILDKDYGKIILTLIREHEDQEEDAARLLQQALKPENHSSIGLKFIIQNIQQLQLNKEITTELLKAILNIGSYVEPKPEQEDASPGTPLLKQNPKYQTLKNNVMLQYTTLEAATEEQADLQAFVKVKNFKEPPYGSLEHDGKPPQEPKTPFPVRATSATSRLSSGKERQDVKKDDSSEPVQWETIPKLIICLSAQIEESKILVQHTEAVYLLRKQIAECAQRMLFVELRDLAMNTFLQMCQSKQNYINSCFEQQLVNTMGFNFGCKYVGTNLTILYKTFLDGSKN